jgi:hypothetical protein
VVANLDYSAKLTNAFAAVVPDLLFVGTVEKPYGLHLMVTLNASVVGCPTLLTLPVACGLRTMMSSDGGEAMMFGHEFRGNGEISWDDGTEFVATTRVRRPVVVSNRSHAVIFLPIHLATLLPSLVFTNGRETDSPKTARTTGSLVLNNSL